MDVSIEIFSKDPANFHQIPDAGKLKTEANHCPYMYDATEPSKLTSCTDAQLIPTPQASHTTSTCTGLLKSLV